MIGKKFEIAKIKPPPPTEATVVILHPKLLTEQNRSAEIYNRNKWELSMLEAKLLYDALGKVLEYPE